MNDSQRVDNKNLQVAAFYGFSAVNQNLLASFPDKLNSLAKQHDVRGSILLSVEGVNGTICGKPEGVSILLKKLNELIDSNILEIKYSWTSKQAFRKFKSKIKAEIVTMGVPGIDPSVLSGTYVEPKDWNSILDDPDVLVIDTRNNYEVAVGTFQGAINPHTDIFRDFPKWVEENLDPLVKKNSSKKIAMFCTGGIRCEKATSYLRKVGYLEVHHLHGGILRYLEEIPEKESRWDGECFVFDQRVALNHQLMPGEHKLCFACGMPLSIEDRERTQYISGIQCHHCIDRFTDADRARFTERQKHINNLAKRLPGNNLWPSA